MVRWRSHHGEVPVSFESITRRSCSALWTASFALPDCGVARLFCLDHRVWSRFMSLSRHPEDRAKGWREECLLWRLVELARLLRGTRRPGLSAWHLQHREEVTVTGGQQHRRAYRNTPPLFASVQKPTQSLLQLVSVQTGWKAGQSLA